jgi:hypothetical protein
MVESLLSSSTCVLAEEVAAAAAVEGAVGDRQGVDRRGQEREQD